jgi:hypothetical protein
MAPSRSSRRDERQSRRDERRHIAHRRCVRYKKLKYRGGRHCGSSRGDECRDIGSCVVRVRSACRVTGEAGIDRGMVEEGKGSCWAISRDGGIGSRPSRTETRSELACLGRSSSGTCMVALLSWGRTSRCSGS